MSVKQISVFAQSKPGHLSATLETFQASGISVRGYSVSDTGDFGVMRFIVDKPDLAFEALENSGMAFAAADVLCLKLEDRPGELHKIMAVLAEAGQNVIYSYSMISTYIVICTNDVPAAEKIFVDKSIPVLSQDDLKLI